MARRRGPLNTVFAFRTNASTAQRIRDAAAADDRQVSAFLRRLVEHALELPRSSGTRSPEAAA